MMETAATLSRDVGKKPACEALDVSRASLYRHITPAREPVAVRPAPPLSLTPEERRQVLDELHNERFRDMAPKEV